MNDRVVVLENELRLKHEDVTSFGPSELKRAVNSLRESEERLRLAQQVAHAGTFEWNIQTGVNTWTPELEALYGLPPGEFPGSEEAWEQMVYPQDRPEVVRRVNEAMAKGSFEGEWRVVWPDGTIHWLYGRSFVFKDESEKPLKLIGINIDITRRKQMEEELRRARDDLEVKVEQRTRELSESESMLRRIIDTSPIPMVVYLEEKNYYINKKFSEVFGYTIKDIPSINEWWLIAYPDELYREFVKKRWYTAVGKAVKNKASITPQEVTVACKDGSKKEVLAYFSSIGDMNLSILQDITGRKLAEEALINSEAKFKAIFESAGAAIFIADVETGNIVECNSNAEALTGRSRNEIIGMHQSRLHPEGEEEKYKKIFALHGRGGSFKNAEAEVQHVDGRGIPVWINAQLLKINGRDMLIGLFFDITERKWAEKELSNTKDHLASELDAMDRLHAISVKSVLDGDLSAVLSQIINAATSITNSDMGNIQVLDLESGRLRIVAHRGFDRPFLDYFDNVAEGRAACGEAMSRKERVVVEDVTRSPVFMGTPDLEVMLAAGVRAVQSTPLLNRSGRLMGIFSTHYRTPRRPDERELKLIDLLARQTADIIERTLAEKQLVDSKAQAELYLDLMGHDINNMNQIALGYLELAVDVVKDDNIKDLVKKPLDAIQNSSRLIDNVRKLQKVKTGGLKIEVIDLDGLLAELRDEYLNVPGKDVAIDYSPLGDCHVMANGLLRDVFSNLIGNSIKHSGPGKSVWIGLRLERIREDGGEYCRVIVEDDGPGIPNTLKENVFERLRKENGKVGGKGLGLYLVKSLVEDFYGTIHVEDRVPGNHTKGARFVVMLPAIDK
ncbi:putative histidine kinase [Methanocella paludicola SANAE]|uniref:histidine kinase n=1 Tax=Methanocella paludicola (strain DSM 17711 / JCM 13418 / NBRC 101707 / SANAE) TaxID=304371 RepID=D1YYA0_METPS|nr:putative histidine kinase [Methanocella paludicola SANAE]